MRLREFGGFLVKICAGGGSHAVGSPPEIDLVQIAFENFILRERQLEPDSGDGLDNFPFVGFFIVQDELADKLLRDRRSTLGDSSLPQVAEGRPQNPQRIDPPMFVEARILDGHDRLPHRPRDVGQRNQPPSLGGEASDKGSFGIVNIGGQAGFLDQNRIGRGDVVFDPGIDPPRNGSGKDEKQENPGESRAGEDPASAGLKNTADIKSIGRS